MAEQAQLLSLLTSISDRLARVELAVSSGGGGGGAGAAAAAAPAAASGGGGGGGGGGNSENVSNHAAFLAGPGAAWLAATDACGKKAKKASDFMKKIFEFNAGLVAKAEVSRKPTDEELAGFGKTVSDLVNKGLGAQFPDRNMEKGLQEIFNAIAQALLTPEPVQTVKDAFEAMQFYTNKVLADAKGKEDKAANTAWVQASEALLNGFRQFLVPSTKGLKYKGKGDPTAAAPAGGGGGGGEKPAAAPAAAAGGGGGPPPPPAGGVPPPPPAEVSTEVKPGGDLAGLFAEISSIDQSSGRTAGLKHVSDKQKAYVRLACTLVAVDFGQSGVALLVMVSNNGDASGADRLASCSLDAPLLVLAVAVVRR
jgi:hypothetical protein